MSIANLSVRTRLFMTLSLLAAAMLAVGLLGLNALKRANTDLHSVFVNNLMASAWVSDIASISRDNVLALDEAIISGDPAALSTFRARTQQSLTVIEDIWAKYQATVMAPGEAELTDDFMRAIGKYGEARNSLADDLAAGNLDRARERRVRELQPHIDAMIAAAQKLTDLQIRVADQANKTAEQHYGHARLISWSAMLIGIGVAGFLGWMLVSSMLAALNTAVQVAGRISGGELGQQLTITSQDEFGRLLTSLKGMDTKLSEIVGTVRVGADAVGTAARQISNGNDDLSQRTQEQAAALEETASSMEEMTVTVKQNADNARQASQLAGGAREQADRGGAIVGRAVAAMGEINEASRRIADIIDVIDEIAFQTNLLALNAAVEAARAGEQGRGFAVVATEVRNLAQRSATAAKEIKGLIGDSVEKVQAGTALVDESGKSLTEIVASVKRVADIVAEISAASEEQAAGIDQVNTAVTQMDSTTQQNAALVEEASAASKTMEHQAQLLVDKIAFFRVARSQPIAATVPARPAVAAPVATVRSLPTRKSPVSQRVSARPAAITAKASGDDSTWQEF